MQALIETFPAVLLHPEDIHSPCYLQGILVLQGAPVPGESLEGHQKKLAASIEERLERRRQFLLDPLQNAWSSASKRCSVMLGWPRRVGVARRYLAQ